MTFAWHADDVAKVFRSMFEPGARCYKYIDLPLSNYASVVVRQGHRRTERPSGFSMFAGYSYNERSMLSLGHCRSRGAGGRRAVTLIWGEAGGGTKKTTVERHKQIEIRVKVSPVPYRARRPRNLCRGLAHQTGLVAAATAAAPSAGVQTAAHQGRVGAEMSRAARASMMLASLLALWPIACAGADPAANKALVTAAVTMLFQQHKVDQAIDTYFAPDYIQHNPLVPTGAAPVRVFFKKFYADHPGSTIEISHVLADGDLVAVHYRFRIDPKDRGMAVVDIFRVANGKIAEHWDVGQPVPEKAANDNGMF